MVLFALLSSVAPIAVTPACAGTWPKSLSSPTAATRVRMTETAVHLRARRRLCGERDGFGRVDATGPDQSPADGASSTLDGDGLVCRDGSRAGSSSGALAKDRLLEPAQLPSRFKAELVYEERPGTLICR